LIEHLVEHLPRAFLMRELLGLDREMISGASSAGTSRRRPPCAARARLRAAQILPEETPFRAGTNVVDAVEAAMNVRCTSSSISASGEPAFRSTRATKIEIVIDHSSQASFSFARAHGTGNNDTRRAWALATHRSPSASSFIAEWDRTIHLRAPPGAPSRKFEHDLIQPMNSPKKPRTDHLTPAAHGEMAQKW